MELFLLSLFLTAGNGDFTKTFRFEDNDPKPLGICLQMGRSWMTNEEVIRQIVSQGFPVHGKTAEIWWCTKEDA